MKILIIKIGALGDVLRTSFIAQGLKDKYENASIFWLTSEIAKPMFINNPYVSKIIVDSELNRDYLKKEKFDLVINLEEDEIHVKFTSSFDAEKIGFILENEKIIPSRTAKEWFDMSLLGEKPRNDNLKRTSKKTHRQLMAELVGVDYKKYEPFLRLNREQITLSKDFSRRYNFKKDDMVVGLILGGADRWPKQLPVDLSVKLIDIIYKKFKCKIILFGGYNEEERNKEIIALAKSPVIDAGSGNDLVEFPALVNTCNFIIATDSLGLHIALALKKKVISLIGPTLPNEIDIYGLGYKVVAKSDCISCLKKDCKSMEQIDVSEIIRYLENLANVKVAIVITAFKEPKIGRALDSILNQKIKYPFRIVVSTPDNETQEVVRNYQIKNKRIYLFKDPGKGKSFAINLLLKELTEDILIFTDGDVYLNNDSVNEVIALFNDSSIGCVCGRPIPEESKDTKYGYWANFLFNEAHKMRKNAFINDDFLECSGYLFAFRNNIIHSFPLDTAEDTIIPYYFWEKGYRIGYAEKAEVFVKNVNNWDDWIKQKVRTGRAHGYLNKYVDVKTTPRTKTFLNEAMGTFSLLSYPRSLNEFLWSIHLLFARLYMWTNVGFDVKIKKKIHSDAWERVESTK
mgnify:CR=1 FL=1